MIPLIVMVVCYVMCPNGTMNATGIANATTPQGIAIAENALTGGFVGWAILGIVFIILTGSLHFSGADFLDAATASSFMSLIVAVLLQLAGIAGQNAVYVFMGASILTFLAQALKYLTNYF